MKIKQYIKRAVAGLLAVGVMVAGMGAPVFAEGENLSGFTMSPMYEKVVINPGESYSSSFKIHNPEDASGPFYYKTFLQPYYRDEENNAIFEDVDGMSEIMKWTTIDTPEKGVLQPGESTTVKFTIDVPATAPAGGQYMTVTVSSDGGVGTGDTGGISIRESVAMGYTVYAEITGTTVKKGEIVEANLPSFLLSGEITGSSLVKNTGNVHGTATYKLQVYPLFSGEEVYTNEEHPDERLVLPNRSLYTETSWEGTPGVGIFKAVYTVNFEGVETVVEKMVIICPIWLLFIIIFAVMALIIWIIMRVRSGKKKKQRTAEKPAERATEENEGKE